MAGSMLLRYATDQHLAIYAWTVCFMAPAKGLHAAASDHLFTAACTGWLGSYLKEPEL